MMFRLALADVLHERTMFLCYAIALAAILAPLLVLYGLKTGVIDALTRQLLDDPRNREIIVFGNRSHDEEWLAELAQRPEVGFLVPRTRSIAATLYLEAAAGSSSGPELAELVPTGPGDPLLAPDQPPLSDDEVALSAVLAQRLGVHPGDRVDASAIRQIGAERQRVSVPLTVAQVRPAALVQRRVAFATVPLLQAVEDYRDGLAVPAYGWQGDPPPDGSRRYASFRLYARGLDDVAPLSEALTRGGLEVRSRVAEIEQVQALDRNLTRVFTLIAGLGGGGYLLSLGASLWSNVRRKQRELSVLRLLGVPTFGMLRFPMIQATLVALCGVGLAGGIYLVAETVINARFAMSAAGEKVCRLLLDHYLLAGLGTLVAAWFASLLPGWQASRIDPSDGMRDV